MKTWTFPEVHPAGHGPWADEPDKAQWVDEATGLDCLIVRTPQTGALCGYVGVPPGHPAHGADSSTIGAQVHGGVNFANSCQEAPDGNEAGDGPYICHVPEPGRPADVWWLGFDCGHAWDATPNMDTRLRQQHGIDLAELDPARQYRTFDYVRAQVTVLAAQLSAAGRS